jgi:hypothetical protein
VNEAPRILEAARAAGYEVRHHTADDVEKIYVKGANPFEPLRLVGMVIVRQGRVRYAEMHGRLFPWWTGPYQDAVEADKLIAHIKETTP